MPLSKSAMQMRPPVIAPGLQGHSQVTHRSYKNAICARKTPKAVSIGSTPTYVIQKRNIQFSCMHFLIRQLRLSGDSHRENSTPAQYLSCITTCPQINNASKCGALWRSVCKSRE